MKTFIALLFAGTAAFAVESPPASLPRNADRLVVAADGSGDFRTVQGAIDFAEPHREKAVVIFIRNGRYEEIVRVGREKRHLHLVGEDRKGTILTYTNNEKLNPGWMRRAVLGVEADDFVLENLTVQNTTPYKGSQAEAVTLNGERCVLRNCDFLSLQDTLNLSGRVYVADSYIEGDVDYVWGYGTACFERCEVRSMHDGCIVQARNTASRAGYVFLDCRLTAAPDVKKCWLARIETTRFPASHVAFIRCAMGAHILPAGWQVGGAASEALQFEEFASMDLEGKPLDVAQRHPAAKQLTAEQAAPESAAKLLAGSDGWNPRAEPVRIAFLARGEDSRPSMAIKASADYLALHVSGKAPLHTTALQYRMAESGNVAEKAPWMPAQVQLGNEGAFILDLPLITSRWSKLQLRALKGDEVLAIVETHRKPRTFEMLTAERIAALPQAEQEPWATYMERSNERFENEYETLAAECRKLGLAHSKLAVSKSAVFGIDSDTEQAWFAGEEAKALSNAVISYQTPTGGWSKGVDYSAGPRSFGTHWTAQSGEGWHYCGTLDNRTTTEQIRFLAEVFKATKREDARAAALHGIEWLLSAQFPNGGWPQNYPVEPGYHEAITLNDNAMTHALELLLDVAEARAPFAFTGEALREHARAAFDKGIACLAAAQVKVDGKRTVWCAQHDPLTLAPVAARKKEPPALSGSESAELLKFLMRRGPANPAITAIVEPAVAWLDTHRITGLRKTKNADGKTDYVADAESEEVYWARFYDVQTGKPIFAGAEDGVIYGTFSEMAAKNKVGYEYLSVKPREVIEKEVVRWRKRMQQEN